jgi:quinol monooxygenase YgiN
MIVVAGKVAIKPERRADAVRAALRMAEATRAESGCRTYEFYSALDDPNTVFIFEEWEDEDALADHFQTEHMAEFQQALPELLGGPVEIKRYVVESVAAM